MNKQLTRSEIRKLSVAERLRLIEDAWDSLAENPQSVEMPEWHRDELDRRIAAHESDPASVSRWSEVKAEILGQLRK